MDKRQVNLRKATAAAAAAGIIGVGLLVVVVYVMKSKKTPLTPLQPLPPSTPLQPPSRPPSPTGGIPVPLQPPQHPSTPLQPPLLPLQPPLTPLQPPSSTLPPMQPLQPPRRILPIEPLPLPLQPAHKHPAPLSPPVFNMSLLSSKQIVCSGVSNGHRLAASSASACAKSALRVRLEYVNKADKSFFKIRNVDTQKYLNEVAMDLPAGQDGVVFHYDAHKMLMPNTSAGCQSWSTDPRCRPLFNQPIAFVVAT